MAASSLSKWLLLTRRALLQIRSRLVYLPVAEPSDLTTDYPDLRQYQDIQFSQLASTPREKGSGTFDPSVWDTRDIVELNEVSRGSLFDDGLFGLPCISLQWQAWLVRLGHNIIECSQIEVLKATAPVSNFSDDRCSASDAKGGSFPLDV